MGSGGGVAGRGGGSGSHVAYYVALGGMIFMLFLLCLYTIYFCINKIREVTKSECPAPLTKPSTSTDYPVTADVRRSASAMAALCKKLPATAVSTMVTLQPLPAPLPLVEARETPAAR